MNALVPTMDRPPVLAGATPQALVPTSFEGAWRIAQVLAASGMAPKDMSTPEKCVVAIMHGMELGLTPMAAVQSIAVVNGRPSLWGDSVIGLVRASGLLDSIEETVTGDGDQRVATCIVKRKGDAKSITSTFSVADAKKAGLWGKSGPWQQYPDRMLRMRARAFALRDGFADVLRGLAIREEMEDVAATARDVTPPPPPQVAPPAPRPPAPAVIDHQTIETAAPSQGVAQDAGARPNPEQSPPDEARAPASAPPPPRQAEPPQQEGAGQDDDGFDAASTMVKIREEYDGARSAADVEEIAALYAEDMDRFTRGQREEIAAWHEAAAARFAEKPAQKPAQARQASAGVRQPPAPRTPPAGQESDFSTDPFTMPASFASTEAYRMWFHEATQNARTDDDLGKVVGAYNLSKEMRAELGVSDGTNIDIRGMIQRMVTRIRGGEPSAPAPADTPSVGATEGSPPVGATKESEPAPSAAEPGVPTTIAEYDAWLERLIAGEPDPERLKKAWFESSDWKDTLDPPPTKAQREAWRKRLFDHVKTLRGEG